MPLFLGVALAGLNWPAFAATSSEAYDLTTGNGLYGSCTSDDPFTGIQCLRYLEGFDDGMATMALEQGRVAKVDSKRLRLYCKPDLVTLGQMQAVIVKFLERAPEIRHLPSNALILTALQRAFPCSKA